MVRAPSVEIQRPTAAPSSIAGGFVPIPVPALMAAWRACRTRPLGIGDFRAWLACHEMAARRCTLPDGRTPTYSADELAALLGVTRRRAAAALRRLEAARLIEWSESAIAFPGPAGGPGATDLQDTIGCGRGTVAIPRRLLRFLADGARPALIATALGILLRCLSRRRAGFDGRGRVKAGWIARAFGVDLRAVKRARRELIALGWISEGSSDPWATRRWGATYAIDLAWQAGRPTGPTGPRLPPIPAAPGPAIATPRSNREPLREVKDQEPGPAGPAGARLSGIGQQTQTPRSAGPPPPPPPRLEDVRLEDLKDTGRLLELHGQAVGRGIISASEADRLHVLAAAEHALAIGKANPAGLFAFLVRGRCWRYLTQGDEDRAVARLKAHRRPPDPAAHPHNTVSHSAAGGGAGIGREAHGGPSDAEIVRAVRAAAIRVGVFRDPWPEFSRINPGWTRERWDAAVG